jgi:hypothetical protein
MYFIEHDVWKLRVWLRWKMPARLVERDASRSLLSSAGKRLGFSRPQPRPHHRWDTGAGQLFRMPDERDSILTPIHINQCVALLSSHVSGDGRASRVPSDRLG